MNTHEFSDGESLTAGKVNDYLRAPEFRSGTFTLTWPSGSGPTTVITATVTFDTPLSDVPQRVSWAPTDPTNANNTINTYLLSKTATGFQVRGYRSGPGSISFEWAAEYHPTAA